MAISVAHSTTVVVADDGTSPVGTDEWNANHTLAGFGTGVETALAVNVGSAGAPVLFNGALGTPSSGVGTNLTGTAAGLTAGAATLAAAATILATTRAIYGNNFDGSAALTQIIASTFGGTGNGFTKFTGPTTSEKTFTLPNASDSLAALGTANTWTGVQQFGTIGGAVGKLVLAGSTSGSSILNAAAAAGSTTFTLPPVTGTLVISGNNAGGSINLASGNNEGFFINNAQTAGIAKESTANSLGLIAGNAYVAILTSGTFLLSDGVNLAFGTTNGTKIGITTSQKIGFWNTTPIVQPTTAIAASTFTANTSLIANDTATWDGYTAGQVVKALRNVGLLA